ncbi:MAG: ATP-binding cassette, subfamily bacterial PglK [Thermoplasmata archaeon]|nr:ATP-binding cassette, subfamily bacterial PglK [Thermoplasmata archaeon]
MSEPAKAPTPGLVWRAVEGRTQVWAIAAVALFVAIADAAGVYLIYVLGTRLSAGHLVESGLSGVLLRGLDGLAARWGVDALLVIAALFFVSILARSALRFWNEQMLVRLQFGVLRRCGKTLFHGYLNLSYESFIERNSMDRINSITAETTRAAAAVGAYARVLMQALNVLVLVLLLLLVSWQAFAFGCAAGLLMFLAIRPLARRSRAIGKEVGKATGELWTSIVEPFRAYRVVVTSGASAAVQGAMERKFDRHLALLRRVTVSQGLLAPVMELAVGAMVLIGVLLALYASASPQDAFPLVLLVLSGTYRIMPAVGGLNAAYTAYRFNEPGLLHVLEELDEVARFHDPPGLRYDGAAPATGSALVELRDASFAYRSGRLVLEKASLAIRPGERVGVVGPSGSGKSTLVDLALGLLRPTEGRVLVGHGPAGERPRVAYVPQQAILLDATVLENLCLGLPPATWDRAKAQRMLDLVGLGAGSAHPVDLDQALAESAVRISGGQRQRLGLARALYSEPDLLILDEPTAALDADSEERLVATLGALPCAMLIVTHRDAPLRLCSRVFALQERRLVPAQAARAHA